MHMAWDLSAIQAGVLRYFTGMRHSSHPLPEACMPIWTWSGSYLALLHPGAYCQSYPHPHVRRYAS